ncbi:MAG: peptide ABC transporter substrate-binding protein [Synergistaceae bacterium]|nr:peptide ABC transporter substrate-binding protein [Synergistaceae bacterium]
MDSKKGMKFVWAVIILAAIGAAFAICTNQPKPAAEQPAPAAVEQPAPAQEAKPEVKAEEIKAEPEAKAEEVKAEPEAKAEEVKAEPEAKAEEVKAEPEAKAEEVKAEPEAKAEEVKAEPEAKPEVKEEEAKPEEPKAALGLFAFFSAKKAEAAVKDTLVVADQYDPTTLDPIGHNDYPTSRACSHIYDTLIFLNPDGSLRPGLAEKWEFLSDKDYKMYLRKGVKFHNGEELKAADVKFSLERANTPAGSHIHTYSQDLDNVEIVDDYTVILHLKKVNYPFFSSLVHSWGNIVNKKAVEAAGDDYGMNPVGTGPFKFVEWAKGDHYTFERFDDYWGNKAKFKTLIVRSIPEPTNRTIELETGAVDIAYPVTTIELRRVDENPELVLQRAVLPSTTYMGFNVHKKPFDDVRVRQAISLALDTVGIQRAIMRGVGKTPRSLIPSVTKYSIDGELPVHTRDLEKARELFSAAGVDPNSISLIIRTNERKERVDMATIIQAQLADLGIKSEIMQQEWGAYLNDLQKKEHDVFLLGWGLSVPDPDYAVAGLLESNAGTNYTTFNDPKLDEMLAKGRSLPDGEERAQVYKDMQLYINEQLPMVYLHNDEAIAGVRKVVKGFEVDPFEVHSFRNVYFEE